MNIAIIGNGGREHAICQKIAESSKVKNVYSIPGNGGTSKISKNIDIDYLDFNKLYKVIVKNKIDFVIVGPEQPLIKGIVDFLKKRRVKVFGPSKYAAQLEGSKSFVKKICKKNKIPTASFKICKKISEVKKFLQSNKFPLVVKADGIAAGKGVMICKKQKEVLNFSEQIFKGKFKSSKKLILEEFIEGEELSYFSIVDKNKITFLGSAQDHKRVGENETGLNTGGMGAYSPAPILTKPLEKKILNKIIKPTIKFLKKKKKPYTGFLYTGLMIKNKNPYLIEYNVRMGDPECQVILPRLKNDLLNLLLASENNTLKKIKIKWKKEKCMTIVLCAKGYPGEYKKNLSLEQLDHLKIFEKMHIFHAGTKKLNGKIFSNGGRVLNFTMLGNSFLNIRSKILKKMRTFNWKHGFFRKDIGWRIL